MKTRRRFTADFKARIALEALRGELTVSELAVRHGLHPNLVSQWRRLAISHMAKVFKARPRDAWPRRGADISKTRTGVGEMAAEHNVIKRAGGH